VRFPAFEESAWEDIHLQSIDAGQSHPAFHYHRLRRKNPVPPLGRQIL